MSVLPSARRNTAYDPDYLRGIVDRAKANGSIQPAPPEAPPKPEEKPIQMGAFVDFDFMALNRVLGLALNRSMTPLRISRAIHNRISAMTPLERADIPPVIREMIEGLKHTILGTMPPSLGDTVPAAASKVSETSAKITSPHFPEFMMRLERSLSWASFRKRLTWMFTDSDHLVVQGAVVKASWEYDRQRNQPLGTTILEILSSMQRFPSTMTCVAQELLDGA